MALTSGSRLGPYEIVAPLGAGGMGEVYRAHDTRLGRDLAIKLLPAAFSANSDRLHRFAQEARSASALNHPNIVTIYELGQDGSSHYIAMELVEGKTLRHLLVSGLLPMQETIDIATQVAEGLTKAHEAGITHRDIKPENLMVSQDGIVKILDFGLAKLVPSQEEFSDLCTLSSSPTQPGLVLGTLGYMSPEQAKGEPLDFRSDQFSLGLVLYEMVTGKRPFQRSTAAETLVAVLREQAEPIGVQNRAAPAPLCWAIERCLAKEPDKRYASTRDLALELAAIRDGFADKPVQLLETHPTSLPLSRTGFVGREKEVAAVTELLRRQDVRLVTITGPGGIGKTRFAVEVASGLIDRFPGGIHFVPLSPLSNPDLIAPAIVQTLGIREAGGQPPLETLKENLRDSLRVPMLLLLDNFEHLIQAASIVAELLVIGPNLKIMVTSRAAMHVYGEYEFPVPPLGLPDPRSMPSLEVLSQSPAVALFVQRAAAAKPDFELNRENAPAVSEICSRLDGLPLAIELAAARVKVLSPSSMLKRLASRLQLLTGGARDLPLRQQTLRATMDWSYNLLNKAEQELFRRFSIFAGGCTLEAVEAVCDTKGDLGVDVLDGMASMVDKSLTQQLEQAGSETRFLMLSTIREYALERLTETGEEPAARRAHAAYYLVLAEECGGDLSAHPEWLERFDFEHHNFREALEFLIRTADADWGMRLGAALFHFWETREHFAEGRALLTQLLELPGSHPTMRPRLLFYAAVFATAQGDFAAGEKLQRASLEVYREQNDSRGIAVTLNALGITARDRGDLATARTLFEQCVSTWKDLGSPVDTARALSNLANLFRLQGEHARASALYGECLTIFREAGDASGVAWTLNYQGDLVREMADFSTARSCYEKSLSAFRELGDGWGVASALCDLARLSAAERDYNNAEQLYSESIRRFKELEHKRGVARVLECFAVNAAAQRRPEQSLRLAGAAAALRQRIGAPLIPADQSRLEKKLEPARNMLSNTAGLEAWSSGWEMSMEEAVREALRSKDTAKS